MADYGKVNPGDPLSLSARFVNDTIDLLVSSGYGNPTQRPNKQRLRGTDLIVIRNDTGADLDLWDAVGIDEPVISNDDNEAEFDRQVCLKVVAPVEEHKGRFAICCEPIPVDGFGVACVSGVIIANVNIADGGHTSCDIGDSQYVLDSGSSGVATILWCPGGFGTYETGVQKCVIRIGGGGGGELPEGQYQHQVVGYMVSQNQVGASFILSHPMV